MTFWCCSLPSYDFFGHRHYYLTNNRRYRAGESESGRELNDMNSNTCCAGSRRAYNYSGTLRRRSEHSSSYIPQHYTVAVIPPPTTTSILVYYCSSTTSLTETTACNGTCSRVMLAHLPSSPCLSQFLSLFLPLVSVQSNSAKPYRFPSMYPPMIRRLV